MVESRSTFRRIAVALCFIVMQVCAAAEGAFIFLGAVGNTTDAPKAELTLRWAWLVFFCATFLYFRRPLATLTIATLYFLLSAVVVWTYFGNDHSLIWFLYQHSLELTYLAVGFLGYLFGDRGEHSSQQHARV